MTKDEFLKKHNLTEADYRNLKRFEEVRSSGIYNVYEYITLMIKFNVNGGERLARWIQQSGNYAELQEVLKVMFKEYIEKTKRVSV